MIPTGDLEMAKGLDLICTQCSKQQVVIVVIVVVRENVRVVEE
jgi:hypothetical protein